MDETPEVDPIATAQALTGALNTLSTRLEGVTQTQEQQVRYGRRNRSMIWGLVASIAADLLLTIPIAWAVVSAGNANDLAEANHANQVQTCLAGNDSRRDVRELWNKVFALSSPPKSEAAAKKIAEFKEFVAQTYADRDCSKI